MSATDNLKEEHEVILRMIRILTVASDKSDRGEKASLDVFEKAMDFTHIFTGRCHHGKEQDTLFPLLRQRGIPTASGPISVMLMEHEKEMIGEGKHEYYLQMIYELEKELSIIGGEMKHEHH